MKSIETEQDYNDALKRLEQIFDAEAGSKEREELKVLADLIGKYEDEHYQIELQKS